METSSGLSGHVNPNHFNIGPQNSVTTNGVVGSSYPSSAEDDQLLAFLSEIKEVESVCSEILSQSNIKISNNIVFKNEVPSVRIEEQIKESEAKTTEYHVDGSSKSTVRKIETEKKLEITLQNTVVLALNEGKVAPKPLEKMESSAQDNYAESRRVGVVKGDNLLVPEHSGIEKGTVVEYEGRQLIVDFLSEEQEQELSVFLNNFLSQRKEKKIDEEEDGREAPIKIGISHANNVPASIIFNPPIEKTLKVVDVGKLIKALLADAMMRKDSEYRDYLEYALKSELKNKEILNRIIKKDTIKFFEKEQEQVNLSIERQISNTENHKVVHISTETLADFKEKPGLIKLRPPIAA